MSTLETTIEGMERDYTGLVGDVRDLRDESISHGKDIGNLIESRRENRSMFRTILATVIAACIIGLGSLVVAVAVLTNRLGVQQQQQQSNTFSTGPAYMTATEAARELSVSTETFREMARDGRFGDDAVKTSPDGQWRVRSDAVHRLAAALQGGGS